jgi:hypothetical protein
MQILEVAKSGAELLKKNIDFSTLTVWQNYVQSVLKLISQNTNRNYYNLYMRYRISMMMLAPYEQVQRTLDFLIELAKQL